MTVFSKKKYKDDMLLDKLVAVATFKHERNVHKIL